MNLRTLDIDDQDQHFIDGAVEIGEMSARSGTALYLYADPDHIRAAIERKPADTKDWSFNWRSARHQTAMRLTALAEAIISQLPPVRRAALSAMGALHLHYLVRDHARYIAGSLYEDITEGGCLWDFHRSRCEPVTQAATKKARRQLMAPAHIRYRIANYSEETRMLRNSATAFFSTAISDLRGIRVSAIIDEIDAVHADLDKVRGLIRRTGRDDAAIVPYKILRDTRRKNRKITRRAAVMAAGLLGASTVSAFARGEQVVLPGRECALVVARTGSMHSQGHGQMKVTVRSLEGKDLADLCVYIDKTPALDQLTAFALHAQAGIEREIIDAANVIRMHPDGVDHEVLVGHAQRRVEPVRADGAAIQFPTRWATQRLRQEEYWAETNEIWLREISVFVFGRQEKLMRSLRLLGKPA